MSPQPEPPVDCSGYCQDCKRVHSLPQGNARTHAMEIMEEFKRLQRLDYTRPTEEADPALGFGSLFTGERGHMFGVLECEDQNGKRCFLRAFSSLRGGIRKVDGWVDPILDDNIWNREVLPVQRSIKELTAQLRQHQRNAPEAVQLTERRRQISKKLMQQLQEKLSFRNFRGQRRSLKEAFIGSGRPPGGVGDCCGPKLLNHASLHQLKPLGLAEFYWGTPTPSGSRIHGDFYPCCEEKCQPILGFMLCGIDEFP